MARPRGYDENTICIAFRIDRESLDFLRRLAKEDHEHNLSAILRQIIHDHISKLKSTPPSSK